MKKEAFFFVIFFLLVAMVIGCGKTKKAPQPPLANTPTSVAEAIDGWKNLELGWVVERWGNDLIIHYGDDEIRIETAEDLFPKLKRISHKGKIVWEMGEPLPEKAREKALAEVRATVIFLIKKQKKEEEILLKKKKEKAENWAKDWMAR